MIAIGFNAYTYDTDDGPVWCGWPHAIAVCTYTAALLGRASEMAYWKGVMDYQALTEGAIDKISEDPHPGRLISGSIP